MFINANEKLFEGSREIILAPFEWGGWATGVYIFLTFLPQKIELQTGSIKKRDNYSRNCLAMDAVERGKSVLGLSFNYRKFQGFLKTSFSSFTTLVPFEWGGSATGVYIFLTFLPQKWLPDLEQSRS